VGDYFGVSNAPHAEVPPLGDFSFSVTRILRLPDDEGRREVKLPSCACYFMMLYLADASHSDINLDGTLEIAKIYRAGTLCLVDLEHGASIHLHTALDAVVIAIPKGLLLEVSRMENAPVASSLRSKRGTADPTMESLAISLRAHVESGKAAESTSFKHLAIAICAHLLQTYGKCASGRPTDFGTLSAVQIAQAQDFIASHLREKISAKEIAASLGISEIEFDEGLINAVGYDRVELINRTRLESAKRLLQAGHHSVRSIAEECGFESEKNFMQSFSRCTAMLPDVWQRSLRH
jgi:AraC-like DNA-binding protein